MVINDWGIKNIIIPSFRKNFIIIALRSSNHYSYEEMEKYLRISKQTLDSYKDYEVDLLEVNEIPE